jgi:hypothetical protein
MKSITLVIFLIASPVIARVSYSQDNRAKVYFIRSTGLRGSPVRYKVFVDKLLTCKLVNDSFYVQYLSPGEHIFNAQFSANNLRPSSKPIAINVEAGKTYYVELMQSDFLICQEVTENSAKVVLVNCVEQNIGL